MAPRTTPAWHEMEAADDAGRFDIDAIVREIALDPTYAELPCYVSLDEEDDTSGIFDSDDTL